MFRHILSYSNDLCFDSHTKQQGYQRTDVQMYEFDKYPFGGSE